jgi:DNA-binding GntR family transcriptional regulator
MHSSTPAAPSAGDQLAHHRVKLVLHRGIVSGTIPAGTRLVKASIARDLEVGTRQVHDALQELAAEGFVRLDARGRAVVHELCWSDLEDLYQIRMLLEPLATARAASLAGKESVMQAVELLAAMESETDAERWAGYNSRFHRVIDESGNSPRMLSILENLRELSARYVRHSILAVPDRAQAANAEHEEIMLAVMARDPAAAADAMFRHLDGTLSALNVRRLGAGQADVALRMRRLP